MTAKSDKNEHIHEWNACGTAVEDYIQYSPVSAMDHTTQKITYAIQSCKCGAIKKTIVARGKLRWLNR